MACKWTQDQLTNALADVEKLGTVAAAARKHGIPPRTLRDARERLQTPDEGIWTSDRTWEEVPQQQPQMSQKVPGGWKWIPQEPLPSNPARVYNRTELLRVLVIPDMHHPYADPVVWPLLLKVAKEWAPHHCVIIGDFLDAHSISDYPKTPGRASSLIEEIAAGEEALDALDSALPGDCRKDYLEGNHEDRLNRLIQKQAPALTGMLSLPQELNLKERGWTWHDYGQWIKIGKIAFVHDIGFCGVNAMHQTLQAFGSNIVFGHTHRGGTLYGGSVEGERHVCMNVGWGGDLSKIDYGSKTQQMRAWQSGCGTVTVLPDGTGFCNFHPIVNGRTVIDGKEYSL